ncbi:amidohydrolase [soil metagenome]
MPDAEVELLIATRRDFHRHPELAFQEHRTAGIVAERLGAAGFDLCTGVAETGVIATLRGAAGEGPTLLLRADMDALPIQEECTHDFISQAPGKMHACGHDAHVAIGLAVAERLGRSREEWKGTIRYMFQPAEEGAGGALRMIEAGALDGVDAALGLHVWLGLPSGVIGVVDGPLMASSRDFRVEIRGRGGHGAIPDETVDATLIAAHAVVALQSIVSRNISPLDSAVLSVGSLHAGSAPNVIADTAIMTGTIRAFSEDVAERIRSRADQVIRGVCEAMGAACSTDFGDQSYPATVNDREMAELVRRTAVNVVGEDRVRSGDEVRTMAAEDFSEILKRVPGCYFFVGGNNPESGAVHPHHSPRFDVCEQAMPVAVIVLHQAALAFLNR